MALSFNPFEDRLSRDIRNDLSHALPAVLKSRSLTLAQTAAEPYLQRNLDVIYRHYIEGRLDTYRQAIDRLEKTDSPDGLRAASLLWDLGLFFEVHEILEPPWIRAQGPRKSLLQALIRAAGVYIYLEAGYPQRAGKIAAKAVPVLRDYRNLAAQEIAIDRLIAALSGPLSLPAPRLSQHPS